MGSKRELHTGTNPGTQNCETMRNCTRPQVSQSFGDWWSRWKVANLWSGTPLCHCALSVLKVSHRSEEGIKYDQVEGYNIRLYTIEMIHFFLTERPSTIVLPNFLQLKPTSLRIRLGCSPIDSKSVSFQTFESCWPVTLCQSASLKRLHTISVGSVLPTQYCWHDWRCKEMCIGLTWKPLVYKESFHKLFSKMVSRAVFHCWRGRKAKLVGRESSAWVKSFSDATCWTWKVFCDWLAIGGLRLVWKLSRCKWSWAYNGCQQ